MVITARQGDEKADAVTSKDEDKSEDLNFPTFYHSKEPAGTNRSTV